MEALTICIGVCIEEGSIGKGEIRVNIKVIPENRARHPFSLSLAHPASRPDIIFLNTSLSL